MLSSLKRHSGFHFPRSVVADAVRLYHRVPDRLPGGLFKRIAELSTRVRADVLG